MRKFTKTARQTAFALHLPIVEAAEFIEREARAGRIPCVEIAGQLFFHPESVDAAIARLAAGHDVAGEVESLPVGSEVSFPEIQ